MSSDSAHDGGQKPDNGFQTRHGAVLFAVRHHDRLIPLREREAVIGRSTDCEVVVHSVLASRRHAKLQVSERGLEIEDLQSRNGVLVNGVPISEPKALRGGDSVGIGDETLEIVELEPARDHGERLTITELSQTYSDLDDPDKSLLTRRADTLQLLGGVVDKVLALGKGAEAERLLGGHLSTALREAKDGRQLTPEVRESAASYAIKLARATNKADWVNYAIDLHRSLNAVLPLSIVDELYELLRKLPPIDRTLLRGYIAELEAREANLSPADRFTVKRIQGLDRLAGL